MDLANKVAIVTGGARDIGGAVSERLAAAGAKVAINYFESRDSGERTLQRITDAGGEAILVGGDMTSEDAVAELIAQSQAAFGSEVDILVNVAGGLVARKTIDQMDLAFLETVLRLNINSAFLATKAVVPHMPQGGSIVNFASLAGRDGGGAGASAYATAKGAVMSFTRAMAKELGPTGIRVNCVCPGLIDTTFHDTFTKDEVRKNIAASTPLRREGRSEEVAHLVAYLASGESSFLNGASIDVNGGTFFS
ncbi:MAG: SDR family oxidoreductase [Proteobacteria bacterium]|nr:SDR family oxidoreductase [Pseudomonadota bacterium]